jgi:hypothetical protein
MTEIELLHKYSDNSYRRKIASLCKMLLDIGVCDEPFSTNINSAMLSAVDIPVLKEKIDEFLQFLDIRKRFDKLNILFNGKLSFGDRTDSLFTVDGHEFSTLDEVERAWKLRAFL